MRKRQIEKENADVEFWKRKYEKANDITSFWFHEYSKAEAKFDKQENDLRIMEKQIEFLVTAVAVYIEIYGCELSETDEKQWRLNGEVRTQDEITAVIKAKNIARNYKGE